MTAAAAAGRDRLLDRALRLFAPVRAGEGGTVLLMALNIFLLMTAYYVIKPVREALILAEWGAEAKIYASAGQALLLLGIVPLYSRLAGLLTVRRLITAVLVFFACCLVGFYGLAQLHVRLGIPFFLWVGIFNMMVVAQFWSFANDVYTPEQGKRLFALVGFGMSAGAVSGSSIAGALIEPLGVYQLMLLSAALLMASLGLTLVVAARRQRGAGPRDGATAGPDGAPAAADRLSGRSGFALVLRNRYLLLIGLMLVLANLVNTTGEYVLGARVTADRQAAVPAVVRTAGMDDAAWAAAERDRAATVGRAIGGFYADFFSVVNLVGLLTQLFLVSRLVGWLGVRRALLVLPLIALGGYACMAAVPLLGVARWAKTAENATDYSLQNTVRNMLFLPTTRDEKYQAKQALDTFFVRLGDVMAALVVLGGTTALHLAPSGFALANVGLAALWVLTALAIGRRFRQLTASA
ncbi:translocase [bacterium]|nr:translocase [bacterium]